MLKDDYPVYFDETELDIRRKRWQINKGKITTQNTTESGKDDIEILRVGKTSIAAQFRCTDAWTKTLMGFASADDISVKFYDPELDAYATKLMRIEGITVTEVKYSDTLTVTNGTYDISFTLVEF